MSLSFSEITDRHKAELAFRMEFRRDMPSFEEIKEQIVERMQLKKAERQKQQGLPLRGMERVQEREFALCKKAEKASVCVLCTVHVYCVRTHTFCQTT